uniref:Uncharacterized protein n=2 Tax=Lepeophtheirus salmonis TaxID=72036 RepID=A0A0K2TAT7_LEPSM
MFSVPRKRRRISFKRRYLKNKSI